MKIFFDCEFTGLHKDTTLISIGMVSEDGKGFYEEFIDYDKSQVTPWIRENVLWNLTYGVHHHFESTLKNNSSIYELFSKYGTKEEIVPLLKEWLNQFDTIEFVSDCCHYDFVLLIDLLSGNALDLPANIAPVCHDINQDIANYLHISQSLAFNCDRETFLKDHGISVNGDKHNALYDALVIKHIYNIVDGKYRAYESTIDKIKNLVNSDILD